jgi:outer membrane protein OmpA-like peptidoglycan-associated protein
MRHPFLASALTLLIGSGIAYADDATQQQKSSTKTQTQTQTQTGQQQMGQQGQQQKTAMGHENVQDVNLFFDTSSSELGDSATSDLQTLADWAKCDTRNAIILEGSADPRGSADYNLKLSGERAASVRQKLIDLGVPSQRIVVSVFGENRKEGSFAHQRRVEARATQTPVAPADLAG